MKKQIVTIALTALFLSTTACQSLGDKTTKGAGIGAVAGGILGGVMGHQTGNRNAGAAIGAGVGVLLGGAVGRKMDKQAAELAKVAETKRTEEGIITKLKSDILFDSGRSELKAGAVTSINELAGILKKYPENRISVMGHTDNTGSDALNQKLSEQRADAVKLQLAKAGVPSSTMEVVGMGPSQPVGDNTTAAGRASNRRVELNITMPEATAKQKAEEAKK